MIKQAQNCFFLSIEVCVGSAYMIFIYLKFDPKSLLTLPLSKKVDLVQLWESENNFGFLCQVREIGEDAYVETAQVVQKDVKQGAAVDLISRLNNFRSYSDAGSNKGDSFFHSIYELPSSSPGFLLLLSLIIWFIRFCNLFK